MECHSAVCWVQIFVIYINDLQDIIILRLFTYDTKMCMRVSDPDGIEDI